MIFRGENWFEKVKATFTMPTLLAPDQAKINDSGTGNFESSLTLTESRSGSGSDFLSNIAIHI